MDMEARKAHADWGERCMLPSAGWHTAVNSKPLGALGVGSCIQKGDGGSLGGSARVIFGPGRVTWLSIEFVSLPPQPLL